MERKIGRSSFPGPGEGGLPPRIPVDRVGGVLQQVGAFLEDQAVVVLATVDRQAVKVVGRRPGRGTGAGFTVVHDGGSSHWSL